MLIFLCYKYVIMHVHIVQSEFVVRQIPFGGDHSPHTDLSIRATPSRGSPLRLFKSPPQGLASVGVGVLGAPDPAPEAVTNYYVTPPPPPWKTALLKTLQCSPLK